MKHPGSAVLLPWLAVVTPGLCRRFPGQNRGVSGRKGTHRSYTRNAPSQTVALPGQTVKMFFHKPGLVRSTAGNIWTQSNSFPIRPGSPRSAGCKLPGRTGVYTGTMWTRLKMNIMRKVCLNKSYTHVYINGFTFLYPVVLVKLMGVYCAYILCVFLSLYFI